MPPLRRPLLSRHMTKRSLLLPVIEIRTGGRALRNLVAVSAFPG